MNGLMTLTFKAANAKRDLPILEAFCLRLQTHAFSLHHGCRVVLGTDLLCHRSFVQLMTPLFGVITTLEIAYIPDDDAVLTWGRDWLHGKLLGMLPSLTTLMFSRHERHNERRAQCLMARAFSLRHQLPQPNRLNLICAGTSLPMREDQPNVHCLSLTPSISLKMARFQNVVILILETLRMRTTPSESNDIGNLFPSLKVRCPP